MIIRALSVVVAASLIGVPATVSAETPEDMFIGLMVQEGVPFDSREDALRRGWSACDRLGEGVTLQQMVDEAARNGGDTRSAYILPHLAASTLCPEHGWRVFGNGTPEPIPAPEPVPAPAPKPAPKTAYYPNCAAAKAAGAAPLHRGDPGYSSKLDRDGDGVACEK
ncbi:excalibur calcium-binding domain-containing protein [Mycobacteroides abscessus]|uniref:excalibur calcium-binding domain-containing protein n=1 Tax=Mycobacteroides abscessus TaxID=36809 RepID=UPI0007F95087|nr:hypothetical protein BAB77_02035 [Mycobacteroides abscessus]ARQ63046.1 hypothetical protein CAK77_02215 [Mycobacteroides abscessus subsp. massiliense]MBE5447540.1 hypothetical protein [Mycobacteroides abscessus]MBE5514161.1 hypothetical protein [Mycobacteroides abscessus]MBN7511784.1 excalibur calcium-binding domain-containing protein [Mycobacteroides abscessus subsp. massiliense]